MLKRILKWFLIGGGVVLGLSAIVIAAFLFLPRFDAISTVSLALTPVAPRPLSPLPATYPKIDRRPPALPARVFKTAVTDLPHYDPASEEVKALQCQMYRALILSKQSVSPDPEAALPLLLEALRQKEWDEPSRILLRRLEKAGFDTFNGC